MPRLIDADALICKWKASMLHMVKEKDGMHPISMEVLIEDLEDAPTIEVEPVKHGRVVTSTDRWHTMHQNCSECGEELAWKAYPKYCPNCGAKMDGGADHAD